ncbi:MAG: MOSC N-terminal beta barrel domain-containing protein [Pseudomonadota bacterium]
MVKLVGLYRYPVKSLAGTAVELATLDRFGIGGDRRWMVVQPNGHFITQRDVRDMALIKAEAMGTQSLQLSRGGDQIAVAVPGVEAPRRNVTVWGDTVPAADAGDAAAHWLSDILDRACRLVYMPEDVVRPVDPAFADAGDSVSFADGYPLLLIGEASLADLNQRLPAPVPMNRFRPNLVVSGAGAFAEDGWRRLRIGDIEFDVAKPCSRCVIPSIVQEDASRDPHINRVLASYRRRDGQIYFGQNLLHRGHGELRVGADVEVLK